MITASSLVPSDALPATEFICDQAARRASAETGVPLAILWSITRTETGRKRNSDLQPWPWTVNMEGYGRWFTSEGAAKKFVASHLERGARNFDVGCFQINYKWHGQSFRSIDHMFDPFENALYAAGLLKRHFQDTRDWTVAAGKYHSRTPKHAERYKSRFNSILKQFDIALGDTQSISAQLNPSKENSYPLLRRSKLTNNYGSLVPLSGSRAKAMYSLHGKQEGS